jgi:ferredoxin
LHAVLLLDHVFGQGLADQHYQARRANTTLVSIECLVPCSENAFCKDMGTWTVPELYDLHLTDLGHEYMVEVGSAKGAALLQDMTGLRPVTEADRQRFDQVMSAKWPRFPYRLQTDKAELPGLLGISYRSQVWEEVGQRCLGCGSCTAVCPTCYCFDVLDEADFDLQEGRRLRVWDSCQFGQFAAVAGGHDFRASRAARQRHRFCHKFKYQPETSGLAGCVGCGRCATACLVNIKPIDVLNDLQRKRTAVTGKQRLDRRGEVVI